MFLLYGEMEGMLIIKYAGDTTLRGWSANTLKENNENNQWQKQNTLLKKQTWNAEVYNGKYQS